MRPVYQWDLGSRSLELGKRTLVMGVVNVTPDSFSDGGVYFDRDRAVEHAVQLLADGADIIDIGGESTRPGAKVAPDTPSDKKSKAGNPSPPQAAVSEQEELERVIPVIKSLKQKKADAVISVDTYKAKVAKAAVESGAEIVNDVSGFRWDVEMRKTLAELKCGAVLMHMRGRPEEWRNLQAATDIVLLVKRELSEWTQDAVRLGIKRPRIVIDPGLGFGKNFEQNYPLLKRLEELHSLKFPLMVGVSRKSFIGRALAKSGKDAEVGERLYGNIAAETVAILHGAHILRSHDVKATVDAARMADALG
ncbi:MAG: dihydropteroate synthase [Acidobacteria bacterium]|nr:MAG: dihydropteroate synthase [Acidobacteriota bacterium]PYY07790.1 MAG: dihydropteroate synthase [Acidobacteriota bacterium]